MNDLEHSLEEGSEKEKEDRDIGPKNIPCEKCGEQMSRVKPHIYECKNCKYIFKGYDSV